MKQKKCFACLKNSSEMQKVIQINDAVESSFEAKEDEIQVSFLLQKFLKIPNGTWYKILQDHGNPKHSIHFCQSCSVLVEDAENMYDHIVLLRKKYRQLQEEFAKEIAESVQNLQEDSATGFEEKLRYYVSQVCVGLENEEGLDTAADDSDVEVEDEPLRYVESCLDTDSDSKESSTGLDHKELKKSSNPTNLRDSSLKKSLSCSVCSKSFTTSSHLKRHELIHAKVKPFRCDHCKKRFSDHSTLRRHIKVLHAQKAKAHHLNKLPSSSKDSDSNESVTVQEEEEVSKSSRSKSSSKRIPRNKFECSVCSKVFTKSSHVKRHEMIHTGEKPYGCDQCEIRYSDPRSLKRHIEVLHKQKKRKLLPDDVLSSSSNLLRFDVEMDSVEKNNNDDIHSENEDSDGNDSVIVLEEDVSKSSRSKSSRKRIPTNKFACSVCSKVFAKSSHVKRHEMIHTGEKPYECDQCEKKYSDIRSLNRHIEVSQHKQKDKKLLSDDVPSSSSSQLTKDADIHSAKKKSSHLTKTCFVKLKSLRSHEKIHTEDNIPSQGKASDILKEAFEMTLDDSDEETHLEKPQPTVQSKSPSQVQTQGKIDKFYVCSFCERVFTKHSHVVRHERIHTGEKPFSCDTCKKRFADSSTLRKHVKTH